MFQYVHSNFYPYPFSNFKMLYKKEVGDIVI